jgi:DNA-binding MarR family transcriptional regulator
MTANHKTTNQNQIMITKKAADRHQITVKQAKLLVSIHEQDQLDTEEIAHRVGLKFQDTRNQIKALEKLTLLCEMGKAGHRILYGITPSGMGVAADVLKDSAVVPQASSFFIRRTIHSDSASSREPSALKAFLEKLNEVRELLARDPALTALIGHLLPAARQ